MIKIIIISPANVATGGTELLQQLCYYLNKNNISAAMYYTEDYEESVVQECFKEYNNPYVRELNDANDKVVVIPETRIDWIHKIKKSEKYIWWLSVDNYYGARRLKVDFAHKLYYFIKDIWNLNAFRASKHLVQSEYARQFLVNEKCLETDKVVFLSDYLNCAYLHKAKDMMSNKARENNILFNPKKGYEVTQMLMEEITEYNWIPLQGFTPNEMLELMGRSKVYVDFGNHPGKDRIPREAALCGCCVITGRRGAAANNKDVPIKEKYKFDDENLDIKMIHELIIACMENYETISIDFADYRESIMKEENLFIEDMLSIFGAYHKC